MKYRQYALDKFFEKNNHLEKKPLIQVAELLHSTLPRPKEAFDKIKAADNGWETATDGVDTLVQIIKEQAKAKPAFIDANCDDAGEGDTGKTSEMMRHLVRLIVEHGDGIAPCIDSSDQEVLRAGLEEYYKQAPKGAPAPLLNSVAEERMKYTWQLQDIGPCNIVYMLTSGAQAGDGMGETAGPEALEEKALSFLNEARSHGFEAGQVFYDATVIPFVVEFSRFMQPGFNYINLKAIERIMSNEDAKGVHTILGITNVIRQFPPGRKMGVVRAFLQIAMDHGLTAGIVDAIKDFGVKPPADEEILEIARGFCEYDGSEEAMERMQASYQKYKDSAMKK